MQHLKQVYAFILFGIWSRRPGLFFFSKLYFCLFLFFCLTRIWTYGTSLFGHWRRYWLLGLLLGLLFWGAERVGWPLASWRTRHCLIECQVFPGKRYEIVISQSLRCCLNFRNQSCVCLLIFFFFFPYFLTEISKKKKEKIKKNWRREKKKKKVN